MDVFLGENEFLESNLKGLMAFTSIPKSVATLFGIDTTSLLTTITKLKTAIQDDFSGDYQKAIVHYYTFYDMVKNKESPTYVPYKPHEFSTPYYKFYRAYVSYCSLTGLIDMSGKGDDEKLYEIYKLDNPQLSSNNPHQLVNKIINVGNELKALGEFVKKIANDQSAQHMLSFLIVPEEATLAATKVDLAKYKSNINDVYAEDFPYTKINELSWYFFESLRGGNPQLPPYDENLKYLIVNYLNNDFETRQKAKTLLIKNDILCQFLDRYPIFSKLTFAPQINNANELYGKLKEIYSTASQDLDSYVGEISDTKSFINYSCILNLYLNTYCREHKGYNRYHILRIYQNKYKGHGLDFFKELIIPHFQDLIVDRVLAHWIRMFTATYWEECYTRFTSKWMSLGQIIMNIPFKVAEGIQNKRGMNKEKFQPLKINTYEGFLGKIFGPLIAIGKFFMGIVKITLMIVKLLMRFASDPFGVLMDILTLIIATLFAVVLVIIYMIISIPPILMIPFAIYFMFTEIILWMAKAIQLGSIFLLILLCVCLATLINVITRGKLQSVMLCENSPGAWYKYPNYHIRNIYERSFMCAKPCPTGYAPSETGFMCKPIPKGHPNYCPQAEIMRIFTGYKRGDIKYSYPDYSTLGNIKYETSLPSTREQYLFNHFKSGKTFFDRCRKPMENYSDISQNICSSLDVIKKSKPNGLTSKDIDRLERLCRQSYCKSTGIYGFCNKYRSFNEDESSSLIKNICMIIFSLIMFTIIVIIIIYTLSGEQKTMYWSGLLSAR